MSPGEGFELILWRHAEAEDGAPDAARRLTERGEKQAERMARWLAARLPKNYRLIASPAIRAQQTARALNANCRTDPRIAVGARPADILGAADWDTRAGGAVVLVGHQPALGQTAAALLCGKAQDWPMKKGAVWWISRRGEGVELRAVIPPALT
ncbi:MAG: histidine phosphatase family protein [Burkholderiales bacterium]|nr:histidine phosphatase family protein [Burkholderiales bacterium]